MSETLAYYSFLPWLRQGLGAGIEETDLQGSTPGGDAQSDRPTINVSITLRSTAASDGSTADEDISKTLSMMGPQDVAAIGTEAYVRHYPRSGVNNFEANGLPYIEFFQEDFLWRFSPASASGSGTEDADRLTPWLALFVLEDGEYTLSQPATGLPYISLDPTRADAVVHAETGHWAWGHVHLSTFVDATDLEDKVIEISEELSNDPDQGLCRLLCPRKLRENASYTAFLVPAFMTGRLAGLGEDYDGVKAQQMAWEKGSFASSSFTRPYDFPVYYSWSFLTSEGGDFESLVAALVPVVVDSESGSRTMDITAPGYGLDGLAVSTTVGLEGALVPTDFVREAFPGTGDEPFVAQMRDLVNLQLAREETGDTGANNPFTGVSNAADPVVAPPLVGRWHALVDEQLADGDGNLYWVHTLNEDPRHRAVAGLGAQVVNKNQEDFMRQAWEQVGDLQTANHNILNTVLAQRVNKAIYSKHLTALNTSHLLGVTKGIQGKVLQSGTTVQSQVGSSLIPSAAISGAFRRIIRPGKLSTARLNLQAGTDGFKVHQQVVDHFNTAWGSEGAVRTAKPFPLSAASIATTSATASIEFAVNNFATKPESLAQDDFFNAIEGEDFNSPLNKTTLKSKLTSTGEALTLAEGLVNGIMSNAVVSSINEVTIQATPFRNVFGDDVTGKTRASYTVKRELETDELEKVTMTTSLLELQAYEAAFTSFESSLLANVDELVEASPLADLDAVAAGLLGELDPMLRVGEKLKASVMVYSPSEGTLVPLETLQPVMAYPEFKEAMYGHLFNLSKKYIYPGIDSLPDNAITLLETNQTFIEAFLAGMNHEMARELLWREYPTDQRGSYFRQFWDTDDNVSATDEDELLDIMEMQQWTGDLGTHPTRSEAQLVLLIRGQLFKKYPNTMVYAQAADWGEGGVNDARVLKDEADSENLKFPIFQATLEPDVNVFGFALTAEEAKGDRQNNQPGWFFVIKERPGQVCFGLDDYTQANEGDPEWPVGDPDTWDDMSWEHLVETEEELTDYHLDVTNGVTSTPATEGDPSPEWGKNAADMASILFQNPVLYARHAQEMLPD